MKIFQKFKPELVLRVSLGVMYLYSGIDLFRHPSAWQWALPYWLKQIILQFVNINSYLRFQGIIEVAIALFLLAWFLKPMVIKWVAFISSLEMATILILAFFPFSETNLLITFRDIGLLGASFSLFLLMDKRDIQTTSP